MLLVGAPEFHFQGAVRSLELAAQRISAQAPTVLLLDGSLGVRAIESWLKGWSRAIQGFDGTETAIIVWGVSLVESDACRLLNAGVKCVLQKTVSSADLVGCFHAVSQGRDWAGECFQIPRGLSRDLTPREHQVIDLLERSYSNKDISQELGIGVGTVKIHIKNICRKAGVHSRVGF